MSNIITARDIEMVTSDIQYAQRQGARQLLSNMIEIGRLLVEAKSMVPYGEWGKYLQERLDYRQSTANNLMKLYQEYGDNQESFFGSLQNSQAFGNLSYTQALALLALPAEERAEFVEKHDVAAMSTRELERAIKERDDNLNECQRLQEQNERLSAAVEEQVGKLEDMQAKEEQAAADAKAAREKIEDLQEKLAKARENEKNAKAALKTAKENPEIPESVMENLRAEVEAEAAKKATEDLQKQLDAVTKEKEAAEANLLAAQQQVASAEKRLALSSPEAAVFKAMFEQVQQDFKKLTGALSAVKAAQPDTGAKLQGAVKTLLGKLLEDIDD